MALSNPSPPTPQPPSGGKMPHVRRILVFSASLTNSANIRRSAAPPRQMCLLRPGQVQKQKPMRKMGSRSGQEICRCGRMGPRYRGIEAAVQLDHCPRRRLHRGREPSRTFGVLESPSKPPHGSIVPRSLRPARICRYQICPHLPRKKCRGQKYA